MNPERALTGAAGLAGVRSLVHGTGRAAVLRVLRSLAAPQHEVRALRLRRVHFKPGRKLATYYEAVISAWPDPVPIGATWFAQPSGPDPRLAACDDTLERRPFARHWSAERSGALLVQVAPLDPVFPHLALLAGAAGVPSPLSALHSGTRDAARVSFVRYRPGQRHVLRCRTRHGQALFAKLYRPGECAPVAASATAFAALAAGAGAGGDHVVAPAALLAGQDALVYARAQGVPLPLVLRRGRDAGDALTRAGRWLRALHALPVPTGSPFRRRTLDDEASRVLRACVAMHALRPDLEERARAIVEDSAVRIAAASPTTALVHGDMKLDHLLWSARGLALLDTDGCALADPALDLGKLIADLRWWALDGGLDDPSAWEPALLRGYRPGAALMERAQAYASMLLVKMAGRRVPVSSRDWTHRIEALLALAASRRPAVLEATA